MRTGIYLLCLTLLLGSQLLGSQAIASPSLSWARSWGGSSVDLALGVTTNASGSVFATGSTQSYGAGGQDVFILNYNTSGYLSWQKTWGGASDDVGSAITTDGSKNIYVTGFTWSYGAGSLCGGTCPSILLLKVNSSGSLLWQETWGNGTDIRAYGAATDSLGNIYAAGIEQDYMYSHFSHDALLLKFNSTGGLLWARTLGDASDLVYGVAVDHAGNAYVTGQDNGIGGFSLMLLKFNSTGGLVWQKGWVGTTLSNQPYDIGQAVVVDSAGNAYVAGLTNDFGAGGNCGGGSLCSNDLIVKFNSTGGVVWAHSWGGSKSDGALADALDPSGNLWVTGTAESFGSNGTRMTLIELSPSGGLLSDKVWGGANAADNARSLTVAPSGVVTVVGFITQAPPFMYPNGNNTLGVSNRQSFNLRLFLNTPHIQPVSRTVALADVSGNQTFNGVSNAALFSWQPNVTSTPALPNSGLIALLTLLTSAATLILRWRKLQPPRRSAPKT